MKKELRFYKLALHKAYFEKGYSLTNYVKYLIALFGLSSLNVKVTLSLGVVYAFFCYFIGLGWYRFGFIEAEIEVSNQFNLFVKQVREKFGSPKSI